jgi:maltoporin
MRSFVCALALLAATTASAEKPGFDFGSYGRLGVGVDGNGHSGYGVNVVSNGSRLELAPYLELNFYYTGLIKGDPQKYWRIVIVPAFASGDLFHYTGQLTAHFDIRNAYAETVNLGIPGLELWAGSRMYRGDDMYLFNYWPLDNLNTVGAGAIFARKGWRAALHIGLNRLNTLYQYETLDTPPRGLGPPGSATVLDRPRFVMSFKLSKQWGVERGVRLAAYGEFHALPGGTYVDPNDPSNTTPLPSDTGWVAGLQATGWLRSGVWMNLWLRTAGGLAAYGDLGVPTSFSLQRTVTNALEIVGAFNLNYESRWMGLMFSGYVRRFRDPAPGDFNPLSYTEGIIAARPYVYWTEYFHTGVEVSYQQRHNDGVDFSTARTLAPQVFRFSVLPVVAPLGRGTYSRPHIYVVYTLSVLNDDARAALFDPLDIRYSQSIVHYIGAGVEWWFNSSYR